MKPRLALLLSLALGLAAACRAAEEKESKVTDTNTKVTAHDMLKALILEENARKQAAAQPATTEKAPASAPAAAKPKDEPAPKSPDAAPSSAADPKETKSKEPTVKARDEPATVLPKVEVNRSRINELDGKIIEQEKQIAREKEHTRPTEIDKALNAPKVSKALSIFGGQSSQQRATVASERVQIMEEERDLLEAMKSAKTKAEKAELQKQLDELRAYRRELEKSLR